MALGDPTRCPLDTVALGHQTFCGKVLVCARASVTGPSSLGSGLTRGRQGVSNQDKEGLFLGELKCLVGGSLRPRQEIGKPDASGQGPFG